MSKLKQDHKINMMNKALGNKFVMRLIDENNPRRAAARFCSLTGYPVRGGCIAVNAVLESRGMPLVSDWTTIVKAPKGFEGSTSISIVDSYVGGGINF